ncbi:hypothetical protein CFOL_v3_09623 [Cephalotus follicularis]|uniref:Uncharacterized protein n=1 Tax=Cephalotus follicularis TaxID=3775 RepID=A0A1Q3BE89_CEPFO|nr:hypothetical protein CFOL_v3_09623 [Cephalotus follicularis]
MGETRTNFRNQSASIHNLEVQVGQTANLLSGRPQGTLPTNTDINPKEQVKEITLRSGKQLQDAPIKLEESKCWDNIDDKSQSLVLMITKMHLTCLLKCERY